MKKFSIFFLFLLSTHTLTSSPKPTSIVVENSYISDIYTVIEKSDGRIMLGSGDEIITLSPKDLPPSFLESWGIDIQKNLNRFTKTIIQEKQNKIAESSRQLVASKLIKQTHSDTQLPFIANSDFYDLGIQIEKGSQFTVFPFYKEGYSSLVHFKIVLRDSDQKWKESTSTSGLDISNYGNIDINWKTKGSNNTNHIIKGYEYRSPKTVLTGTTASGERIYATKYYIKKSYFLEATDINAKDTSIAYRTFGGKITRVLINKHTQKIECGKDEDFPWGDIKGTKWLVISSDGSLRQYKY